MCNISAAISLNSIGTSFIKTFTCLNICKNFFITHDIREALRLGTRVMIMKDGNIEQFDTPGVVKKQPQTEFVRQLLSYLNE